MAKLALLTGKGKMEREGSEIIYPIYRLRITTDDCMHEIDVKLDKVARRIIPYMFAVVDTEQYVEDDMGNKLKLYGLKERNVEITTPNEEKSEKDSSDFWK